MMTDDERQYQGAMRAAVKSDVVQAIFEKHFNKYTSYKNLIKRALEEAYDAGLLEGTIISDDIK